LHVAVNDRVQPLHYGIEISKGTLSPQGSNQMARAFARPGRARA